jgi:hypothetical protein
MQCLQAQRAQMLLVCAKLLQWAVFAAYILAGLRCVKMMVPVVMGAHPAGTCELAANFNDSAAV